MASKAKRKTFTMSADEYHKLRDDDGGICVKCGEHAFGVEPDAEDVPCEACGEHEVHGIENALIMGLIVIED